MNFTVLFSLMLIGLIVLLSLLDYQKILFKIITEISMFVTQVFIIVSSEYNDILVLKIVFRISGHRYKMLQKYQKIINIEIFSWQQNFMNRECIE